MSDQPPKKKRRQNVACDPCKLRRIKCDLLTLISSLDTPSASTTDDEPAHLLVRRYPGVTCTQCRNKGLQCSTEGILNPIKPNKGGKRIEEARKKFGAENSTGTSPTVLEGEGVEWMDAVMTENLLDQLGIGRSGDEGAGVPSTAHLDNSHHQTHSSSQATSSSSLPPDASWVGFPTHTGNSAPTTTNPSEEFLQAVLTGLNNPSVTPSNNTLPNQFQTGTQLPRSRADVHRQALEMWERLSVNTPQAIANRSSLAPSPSPPHEVDLDAHTPRADTLLPALGRLDIETNTFLPIVPLDSSPESVSGANPRDAHDTHTAHSGSMIRYGPSSTHSLGQNGKRQRAGDSTESSPGSSARLDMLNPWERDPWHIWQSKDEEGSGTVAWSRKEQVQESLADKALGIELSRHLITVYFQAVHYSLPVLSPESFYIEWEASGRRTDRMSPASEALCTVLEAWASRYSDNPAILGLPYQRAHTAPKVITANGEFTPGTQARAHWGKARLPVCNALLDRAGRVIDANSLMRRPSVTGLQALSLYNQLMHMSDQGSRVKDQWIQNMIVHSTIIEQMKLLQMFWTSGDPIVTSDEINTDTLQMRMKQRRLFWTTAVADACWASATGLPPKIPAEELEAGRAWVDEVLANLPDSTMKILAFFMKIWHRLSMVGRKISLEITMYNGKKGIIPVQTFCTSIQQCWGEIRSIVTELNESALGLLGACEPGMLGFSPLNYITNMRLCCPFFLLVLHEAIRNHLAFRQSIYNSYVVEPESESAENSRREQDLGLLNKIHLQSVDVLLYNCRSQMEMFKDLLPTGIIQSASIMIRVLIASGQFMAEVPTNEQGYPASTLGGYGWTWQEKQRCISICTDALYQIGWAWSDVTDVLEAIHVSMERMTPSPEIIESYDQSQDPINVKIQLQRSQATRVERDGLQAALRFWPPKSIPLIIAQSMGGMIDEMEEVKHIPRGLPGSDLGQHLQRHLGDGTLHTPGTTSSTATPGLGVLDNQSGFRIHYNDFNGSDSSSGSNSHTSTVPSSALRSEGIASHLSRGTATGTYDPSFGSHSRDQLWAESNPEAAEVNGDQSFWEMMNGVEGGDLDFSAFLNSLADEGSAI